MVNFIINVGFAFDQLSFSGVQYTHVTALTGKVFFKAH
jgi:hypothetical protein